MREWGGGSSSVFATLVGLFFVLLGDFRVFLLVFGLSRSPASLFSKPALLRAALFTALVPAGAYALFFGGKSLAASELDPRWLWLTHESLFIALALGLRHLWLPRRAELSAPGRRFLSALLGYSAAYYALWASADLVILAGFDAGYALRILPNQLYYAFWIPFVWWRFGKSAASSKT